MTSLNHDDFADTDDIPVTSLQGILDGRKNPDYEKVCFVIVISGSWGCFGDHREFHREFNGLFDLPMEQKVKGVRSATCSYFVSVIRHEMLDMHGFLWGMFNTYQYLEYVYQQCNDWTENFGDVSSWTGPSKTNFSQGTLKKKRLP
ncbi:unnamed protein product [Malus baccata var. baccata]